MPLLSSYELDITKELMSIALANAADSFSKMANEKVMIRDYDLQILEKTQWNPELLNSNDTDWYVLTTDVIGKLTGKSYLLLNQNDAQKIFRIFTPSQAETQSGDLTELQEAVLLELDNIITAAMVTQLSNFLSLATYGDIPNLKYLTRTGTLNYLNSDVKHYDVIINVRARFQSYETNMSPTFICFFKSEFLAAIKQMIAVKSHLSLVKR
jgi:chemotaxis protein CheY-P-specific phosphatase CheC